MELSVQVKGEIIASNLPAFREFVTARLAEINTTPTTREELGQAQLDAKMLKETEDNIAKVKADALAQAHELNEILTGMDAASEEIRQVRLLLDKKLKEAKEQHRKELIAEYAEKIPCEPENLDRFRAELENAARGKRTEESMRDALNSSLAILNGRLSKINDLIADFESTHGTAMTQDKAHLQIGSPETVKYQLDARKVRMESEAKLKAEREQIPQPPATQSLPDSPFITPAIDHSLATQPPQTPEQELAAYRAAFLVAMAPLKSFDPINAENATRIAAFRSAVNAAYTTNLI